MKRDPELIRQILLKLEEHDHGFAPNVFSVDGYSKEQVGYHTYLLDDAGYLKTTKYYRTRTTLSPNVLPVAMTHAEHEFLDAIRDEAVWKNTKSIIAKTGGWTLGVIASVATEIITRKAMAAIGS